MPLVTGFERASSPVTTMRGGKIKPMKHFMEKTGLFELMIPVSWEYSLHDEKVYTFKDHDNTKIDTFQISLIDARDQKIVSRFRQWIASAPIVRVGAINFYCLPDNIGSEFATKIWTANISEYIVNFTLTYSLKEKSDIPLTERLKDVYSVMKHFEIIESDKRIEKLKTYRFLMFLKGIAATTAILNNAVENRAFMEATCILANQIDALLRTGIVLKMQLLNKNSEN